MLHRREKQQARSIFILQWVKKRGILVGLNGGYAADSKYFLRKLYGYFSA
jgi:hypothetical protein